MGSYPQNSGLKHAVFFVGYMLILVDKTLHITGDMGLGLPTHIYIYVCVCILPITTQKMDTFWVIKHGWLECWIFPALSASIDRSIAGTSSLGTKSRCSTGAVAVAVVAATPVAGAAPGVSGRSSCSSTSFSRSRAEDRRAMGSPWEMPT